MFVRPCWRPRTDEEMHRLIDENPWALLVNNGDDGPQATNLPLLLDRSRGKQGVLVGHLARANDHSRALPPATPTLAIFEGPYSFVTASWYPNRDMPSTYYYTAVHCSGPMRLQSDAELERWLGVLTDRMERPFPNPWKVTDIPRSEITRRLPSIVGFEIEIERMDGKFKLGQDEPRKDALAVSDQLSRTADPSHRALARMIRQYNEDRTD